MRHSLICSSRLSFTIDPATTSNTSVGITFTESPLFVGRSSDATTDLDFDMAQFVPLTPGTVSVYTFDASHVRGAFKYATFFVPGEGDPASGQAFASNTTGTSTTSIGVSSVTVNFTACPNMANPRAYSGFFSSSDALLNRIWYAGAYTLQLTSVAPAEGGALINYNRLVDGNTSPDGSWYNNFTISNGTSVTVDGAKRDRMVYAGDMSIAVPGIAVSTYDMASVAAALQTLFAHAYHGGPSDGGAGRIRLPYAGPPFGNVTIQEFSDTYHLHALAGLRTYVQYSGDMAFARERWTDFVAALQYSLDKVQADTGLMFVTTSGDWLRPGMGGLNIEAQALLYRALTSAVSLASWLGTDADGSLTASWTKYMAGLQSGVQTHLWNNATGLFSDNTDTRTNIFPQDGNSLALVTGLVPATSAQAGTIAANLAARWTAFGAPAVEAPGVISPFASGFELSAHTVAGNASASLELIRRQWGYLLTGPGMTGSTFLEGFSTDGNQAYPLYSAPSRNSHAHGWSAGPTSFLIERVLGITLLEPAGRSWSIAPVPADLDSVAGGFQTVLGKFSVSYVRAANGTETLEVITPNGTVGTVIWPGATAGVRVPNGGGWRWTKTAGRIVGGTVRDGISVDQWQFRADMERREAEKAAKTEVVAEVPQATAPEDAEPQGRPLPKTSVDVVDVDGELK